MLVVVFLFLTFAFIYLTIENNIIYWGWWFCCLSLPPTNWPRFSFVSATPFSYPLHWWLGACSDWFVYSLYDCVFWAQTRTNIFILSSCLAANCMNIFLYFYILSAIFYNFHTGNVCELLKCSLSLSLLINLFFKILCIVSVSNFPFWLFQLGCWKF